jgi:hypothetical protein
LPQTKEKPQIFTNFTPQSNPDYSGFVISSLIFENPNGSLEFKEERTMLE